MSRKASLQGFLGDLPKNLFAGFVVSLVALPLGLGLALASEAPPISGVIAAVVGGAVVALLGGSQLTITGPGNGLVIVLLSAITSLGGWRFISRLPLYAGCHCLLWCINVLIWCF